MIDHVSQPAAFEESWNPYQQNALPVFRFVPEQSHPQLSRISVNMENPWKIEQACIWYLCEKFGLGDQNAQIRQHQIARSSYDSIRTLISTRTTDQGVVYDISKVAVDLLCRTSGLSNYVYAVGANVPMEQVLHWRLSPSLKTRLAITKPFSPTPLQYTTPDYPIVIDFINWPTIRDQLIIKLGSYDLDQLIIDIVANTVIELPEARAAVNIHDTFVAHIWSNISANNTPECVTSALISFLGI